MTNELRGAGAEAETATPADLAAQLAACRARFRLLCDAAPDVVLFHDGAFITEVGGNFSGLLGWTATEAIGQPILGPWVHAGALEHVRDRIAKGFQGRYQTNAQHRDGTAIPVELHVRQEEIEGAVVRVVILRDLRPQIAAQEKLAEGDARFRTLLEAAFDGMVVHRDGYVLETNEGFARMVGARPERVIGMMPGAVVTPESVPIIMEHIQTNSAEPYEVVGVRPDGSEYPMQIQGRKVPGDSGIRVTGFRDLTRQREAENERQRLQAQLLQAQKLEGLGIMAGGIAHDFNNLLTVILGNTDLAISRLSEDDSATNHIRRAIDAATRAAELTRQMLAYAGRAPAEVTQLDLSTIVRETAQLLRVAVPKGASFEAHLASRPLVVRADRGQLAQVVMNLITNAAEALPEGVGTITLRTRRESRMSPHRRCLVGGTTLPSAPCALLEVTDTGSGIDPGDLSRIFDPFYSTRFQGRGLGLATVLGIVRSHGGAISVDSAPGEGTQFRVLLPLAEGGADFTAPPPIEGLAFRGRAIVVDDEAAVGAVAVSMVEGLGGTAELLASGEALLQRLSESAPIPHVVLLDRVMPGMGGDATLRAIRERWPSLPVLVVSGRERPEELEGAAQTAFLPKPFRRRDLVAALGGLGLLHPNE